MVERNKLNDNFLLLTVLQNQILPLGWEKMHTYINWFFYHEWEGIYFYSLPNAAPTKYYSALSYNLKKYFKQYVVYVWSTITSYDQFNTVKLYEFLNFYQKLYIFNKYSIIIVYYEYTNTDIKIIWHNNLVNEWLR